MGEGDQRAGKGKKKTQGIGKIKNQKAALVQECHVPSCKAGQGEWSGGGILVGTVPRLPAEHRRCNAARRGIGWSSRCCLGTRRGRRCHASVPSAQPASTVNCQPAMDQCPASSAQCPAPSGSRPMRVIGQVALDTTRQY